MTFLKQMWEFILDMIGSLFFAKSIVFEQSGISVRINNSRNIGEGAFSVVYKATKSYDRSQKFAVKKMLVQSKEFEMMIQTEIESFTRFRHKNILRMIDNCQRYEDNMKIVYLLFPFERNGSLRDELNKISNSRISKPSLLTVLSRFNEICSALNVLHTFSPKPFIHQDIKPEVLSFIAACSLL